MYFEYIIPEFLKEYKLLYLAVFGCYLSLAYWILLFLRDQTFLMIRELLETIVLALGTIITRTYETFCFILTSPMRIMEVTVMQKSSSFQNRIRIFEIMSDTCGSDYLSDLIRNKLKNINTLDDLVKFERSLPELWENSFYEDEKETEINNVGIQYATESSHVEKKESDSGGVLRHEVA